MSQFFTNYRWAQIINVTPNTIQYWIEKSLQGSIDLELGEDEGRLKIKNTEKNRQKLNLLKHQSKKFNRQKETTMEIQVNEMLYSVFNFKQIDILLRGLHSHQIPVKLTYIGDKGAGIWDSFYNLAGGSTSYGAGNSTYQYFLNNNMDFILSRFYKIEETKLNIVDLGAGNGAPIIPFLRYLQQKNLLNAYVAVDISQEMLEIVESNVKEAGIYAPIYKVQADFDVTLPFEKFSEFVMGKNGIVPSLFCIFGGQISNNEAPEQARILQNLLYGMVKEDRIFIINAFHAERTESEPTSIANFPAFQHEEFYELNCWIPELLGLTKDLYTPVFEYNERSRRRLFGLKLNQDVRLHFQEPETVITLKKDEVISCWKHRRENKESVLQLARGLEMDSELIATNLDNSILAYLLNKE